MDLIDEEDDILRFDDIIHNALETLFEFSAVLRSRDERRHGKRDDTLVFEQERHLAVRDALGKPLSNGGLANTCLTEEDGIVLRAPRENLDDTVDLRTAADDGIKPSAAGNSDQIAPEFFE